LTELQLTTSPQSIRDMSTKALQDQIASAQSDVRALEGATKPLIAGIVNTQEPVLDTDARNTFKQALATAVGRERLTRELIESLRRALNKRGR
jgi:hypothetical protein